MDEFRNACLVSELQNAILVTFSGEDGISCKDLNEVYELFKKRFPKYVVKEEQDKNKP